MTLPRIHHTSRVLFETPLVLFGFWRCPPDSELWRSENCIGDRPVLALPWTSVVIEHAGASAKLVTPNDVVYYGAKEPYKRQLSSDRGDLCTFISPSMELVQQVAAASGVDHRLEDGRPLFPFRFGPASSAVTVLQHSLARLLMRDMVHEALEVEELLTIAVHRLVTLAATEQRRVVGISKKGSTARNHRDIVAGVRAAIAHHHDQNLSLTRLASLVHTSPYHLCRIFKSETGQTVSGYSRRLRLRLAAEHLAQGESSIISIALGSGFGSHAHFTSAWKREFGFPPSALRRNHAILPLIRDRL